MRRPAGSRLWMRHLQAVRMGTVQLNEQLAWEPLGRQSLDRRLPVLDQVARGAEYRKLAVRSALNSPEVTHMGFWSINPYIGCEFGCTYCYARDTHRYAVERAEQRDGVRSDDEEVLPPWLAFEKRILVKTDVAERLARTLDPSKLGNDSLVIGTATDPYQPAERKASASRSQPSLPSRSDWKGASVRTSESLTPGRDSFRRTYCSKARTMAASLEMEAN